jgi:hypothetical protein
MDAIRAADFEINYKADPVICYEIEYSDSDIECARTMCMGSLIRGFDFTNGDGDYLEAVYIHYEEGYVITQVVSENGIVLPISERRFVYMHYDLVESLFFHHFSRDFTRWPKNREEAFHRWTLLYSDAMLRKLAALNYEDFKSLALMQEVDQWMMQYFALRRGNYSLILDCDIEVRTKTNALEFLIWMCWKRCQEIYGFHKTSV